MLVLSQVERYRRAQEFLDVKLREYSSSPHYEDQVISVDGKILSELKEGDDAQVNDLFCCVCRQVGTRKAFEMVVDTHKNPDAVCGHVICQKCFLKVLQMAPKCPICKTQITGELTRGYRFVREFDSRKMVFKCSAFRLGCSFTGTFTEYLAHMGACRVPCPFAILGCSAWVAHESLREHLERAPTHSRVALKLVLDAKNAIAQAERLKIENDKLHAEKLDVVTRISELELEVTQLQTVLALQVGDGRRDPRATSLEALTIDDVNTGADSDMGEGGRLSKRMRK